MATDLKSADDSDFGFAGDPPGQEEIDVGHKVAFVCGLLDQAARGQHTARALSEAFASVANRSATPITCSQAQELRTAAERARLGAHCHLPPNYRRSAIELGMQAVAFQIDRWRLTGAELRLISHPDALDAAACARIFRNDCHNIALCEEIADRAARRATDRSKGSAVVIAEILQQAANGVATSRSARAS